MENYSRTYNVKTYKHLLMQEGPLEQVHLTALAAPQFRKAAQFLENRELHLNP